MVFSLKKRIKHGVLILIALILVMIMAACDMIRFGEPEPAVTTITEETTKATTETEKTTETEVTAETTTAAATEGTTKSKRDPRATEGPT